MQDRVCYFSKDDLSLGHYLEMAEKRIQEVSKGDVPADLEGIIELWHIKRMFENDCRLLKWDDNEFQTLKNQTNEYNSNIAKFFNGLNPKTIKTEFEHLEWGYKKTFWEIIDAYKLYKLLEPDTLREILTQNINYVREILECQGIVEKFKGIIREILLNNEKHAYILLEKYVIKHNLQRENEIYLPSNLTLKDKEQLLINYLQSDEPNINYVRLIPQIKDSNQIKVSPKTRLLAEKLAQKLNDELMSSPTAVKTNWSVEILFVDDEKKLPVELNIDEKGVLTYTYSIPYIKKCDNIRRITNCISLFGWLNNHRMLNLINKRTEVDTMESVLIDKGKDAYPTYIVFGQKNRLSLYQLYAYRNTLNTINCSFEGELKLFYEHYLKNVYGYPGLVINLPNADDSALNKCLIICPVLDAIVKQYNVFVDESEIDKELIRLSKPLKVEEGKSLLENKYFEIAEDNNDIKSVLYGLFGAGNSLLAYVDPFKNKNYHSLVDLLTNEEKVLYSNYHTYQKPHLDFLIKQGVIGVNADGYVYVSNPSMVKVLRSLWEYDACSYWHYEEAERKTIDDMCAKGWLMKDNHLLSRPERDYFSYYLDNMKFTNGMAYRNHYAHGDSLSADDINSHSVAYITFLELLTILLLKIEDDLCLARKAKSIN